MNPSVLLERVGGVSVITLNRPDSKNALDPATVDLLIQIFRAVRYDDEVRAVVLTGAGSDFCAGGDVKLMDQGGVGVRTTEQRRAGMTRYRDLVVSISSLDKPVIAAVNGFALGGGLELALIYILKNPPIRPLYKNCPDYL